MLNAALVAMLRHGFSLSHAEQALNNYTAGYVCSSKNGIRQKPYLRIKEVRLSVGYQTLLSNIVSHLARKSLLVSVGAGSCW